jgi:putative ABC transport system permease protein
MIGIIWKDIRYGARMLLKSPGFTAVAALSLALGIGANTAIFSVVNAILLRPLSYRDPDQLVMLWERNAGRDWNQLPTSFPTFVEVRETNKVFTDLGAFTDSQFSLTGGDEPERVSALRVSTGLLALLGVEPMKGRIFLEEEGVPGSRRVLILSHGLWQRRFGSDPEIVGRTVALNGESHVVVGVMSPSFRLPPAFTATIATSQIPFPQADLWVPLTTEAVPMVREVRNLFMIGRLKPGVTPGQAQAEMDVIARRLESELPTQNAGLGLNLVPLHQQVAGNIQQALFILLGAVGFVLLIACANVANLLLAKAVGRQKEIAIRTALGATRRRLIRQLLTESALLGLLGGAIGLLLSYLGVRLLTAFGSTNIPRLNEIDLDARVLIFALLTSLVTAMIFGLAPALYASKLELTEALKEGGRSASGGARRNRLRNLLVVSEVALALVLSVAAGLMMRSFLRLQNVNPGFNAKGLVTLEIQLPEVRYQEKGSQAAFQQQLLQRIASLPGAQAVATVNNVPFSGNEFNSSLTIEGRPIPPPTERPRAFYRTISPGYFQTMGIPLRQGRAFTDRDNAEAPGVAIINEAAARRFWGNEDPLGKRIKQGRPESQNPWVSIVGVIASTSHTALDVGAQPEIYLPYLQNVSPSFALVARGSSDVGAFAAAVRREVSEADRDLPVSNLKPMEALIANSVALPRLYTLLLSIFAAVALILAAVGIYGVMSYSVSQRTQEIGVRMALGAQQRDIYKLVLGQSMLLIAVGLAAGLILSLILTRALSSLLYEVSATDPITFAIITVVLVGVALLASYLPARRAARVHPMVALRQE